MLKYKPVTVWCLAWNNKRMYTPYIAATICGHTKEMAINYAQDRLRMSWLEIQKLGGHLVHCEVAPSRPNQRG